MLTVASVFHTMKYVYFVNKRRLGGRFCATCFNFEIMRNVSKDLKVERGLGGLKSCVLVRGLGEGATGGLWAEERKRRMVQGDKFREETEWGW